MQQLAARSSSRVNLVRYARMRRIDRTVTNPFDQNRRMRQRWSQCSFAAVRSTLYYATTEVGPMIRCMPNGICSWNFRIIGEEHDASLEFNWTGEQGAITADGVCFDVRKHGAFSGHWTLEHDGKEIVSGQKSTVFTRTFEIHDPNVHLVLRAVSPFGRSFVVEHLNKLIATIAPDHAFTRRAKIDLHSKNLDFATICFSFWLVVLTWRRAQQNSS